MTENLFYLGRTAVSFSSYQYRMQGLLTNHTCGEDFQRHRKEFRIHFSLIPAKLGCLVPLLHGTQKHTIAWACLQIDLETAAVTEHSCLVSQGKWMGTDFLTQFHVLWKMLSL